MYLEIILLDALLSLAFKFLSVLDVNINLQVAIVSILAICRCLPFLITFYIFSNIRITLHTARINSIMSNNVIIIFSEEKCLMIQDYSK